MSTAGHQTGSATTAAVGDDVIPIDGEGGVANPQDTQDALVGVAILH